MSNQSITRTSFLIRTALVVGLGLISHWVPLLGAALFVYWVFVQVARVHDIGLTGWVIGLTSGVQVLLYLQDYPRAGLLLGLLTWAALAIAPSGSAVIARKTTNRPLKPHFTTATPDLEGGRPMPRLSSNPHFSRRLLEDDEIDLRQDEPTVIDLEKSVSPQN